VEPTKSPRTSRPTAAGLGDDFTAALDATFRHMEAMPRIGSVERYAGVDVRRRQIDGYEKYLVVYVELRNEFVVVAVMHGRRHPGHWKKRIRALR
jgi:plasmid stabilization system protein ParE